MTREYAILVSVVRSRFAALRYGIVATHIEANEQSFERLVRWCNRMALRLIIVVQRSPVDAAQV